MIEIKPGQLALIDSPFNRGTDDVIVCTCVMSVDKYCITMNGKRCRSLGRVDGVGIKFVTAEEEGCVGDEKVTEYNFTGSMGGSYTMKEEDITDWNVRFIDKNHPKYDAELSEKGIEFGEMMGVFSKMFPEG
jgi:hypothetical protein